MISVPKTDDSHLPVLIKALGLNHAAFEVKVKPDPAAQLNECFNNVDQFVLTHGGTKIVGWQIWDYGYMIEAELHAVWQSLEGDYLDISPKALPISHILFAEDFGKIHDGRQKNNVRINTTHNNLVDDYIALANAKFAMSNKGDLADVVGEVVFRGVEADKWQAINSYMVHIELMLAKGQSRNSTCFCSSGLKYKQCHGQDLISKLQRF